MKEDRTVIDFKDWYQRAWQEKTALSFCNWEKQWNTSGESRGGPEGDSGEAWSVTHSPECEHCYEHAWRRWHPAQRPDRKPSRTACTSLLTSIWIEDKGWLTPRCWTLRQRGPCARKLEGQKWTDTAPALHFTTGVSAILTMKNA